MDPVPTATDLALKLSTVIVNPLLALIFAIGLLVFIWGIVQYMWALSTAGTNSPEGKKHMFWGLIGMFVMVAAYAILRFIVNTVGASGTVHL